MMHPTSLRRTALVTLSLGSLIAPTTAQASASAAMAAPQSDENDDVAGLPSFLLKVPGGTTQLGLEVDAFVQACAEAAFVFNPSMAHKAATEKFVTIMSRTGSVFGRQAVDVETFYLGKWPVKNSEWLAYVDRLRAAKVDVRPPFHWWRYGRKDDYEAKLKDIRKEFPEVENAPLQFWERHGHELPYKVVDEDGKSIADHPVVFVSWRDANRFAASLGMRLPTEAELTRAMRGDGTHAWPGGEDPEKDHYTQEMLTRLGMGKTSDLHTKPVGTIAAATGPYGHLDLFGQVWQFVGDVGYMPINGMKVWNDAWEDLQKHKTGRLLEKQPVFLDDRAIAKGGSYLSYQEPIQLLIDARAPMMTSDVFESLGLRLAKSLAPGYDYVYSLQRVEFTRNAFAKDQDIDLTALVGAEHYTLGADGFPTDYKTVAFAPANWISAENRLRTNDMRDQSQERPVVIGALASSVKLHDGTAPGLYTVYYRAAGVTKDLRDAIKRAHKEVVKARKAAEKAKGKEKDDEQDAASKHLLLAKKYGLTEDDLADNKASTGDVGFVRIDGVEVPTDSDTFLLSARGEVKAALRGTKRPPASENGPRASEIEIVAGQDDFAGKAVVQFKVAMPMIKRDAARGKGKVVVFELPVPLDIAPPAPNTWRMPAAPEKK